MTSLINVRGLKEEKCLVEAEKLFIYMLQEVHCCDNTSDYIGLWMALQGPFVATAAAAAAAIKRVFIFL